MQRPSNTRPLDELNRRRSAPPDAWAKGLRWIALAGWSFQLAAGFIVGVAKPQMETFFDRHNNIYVRKLWDTRLTHYGLLLAVLALLLAASGISLNLWRQQVNTDEEFRYNLAVLALAALALTTFCLFGL